ncbi:MAG: 3-oxoacyl-ACP reductase [Betaproteobacteria bacterium]|nr:3-oxoacyl-ACP reductase [Betaproteobacteria bacterium]
MEMKSRARRVALVTGGSQGLGAAIALRLARDGYDLAVTELTQAPLEEIVSKLKAAGARAVPIALDIRSQPSVESAVAQAAQAYGQIDVLVNNAGVTQRRLAIDVTRDEWQTVMDVNLTGTFFMSQQFARHLVSRKAEGAIVSLASTHGVVALAERATYGISKGAIIHMTRMLAYEWAGHGIRVNAIAPGTIETPSRAGYFEANPGARVAMLKRVPVGKFGTEDDVAAAVSYLAGTDSAFVTGQTLLIDGGLTTY